MFQKIRTSILDVNCFTAAQIFLDFIDKVLNKLLLMNYYKSDM